MKIPASWKTVTPFSKYLALSMFIIVPIISYRLGMEYQKSIDVQETSQKLISCSQAYEMKIDEQAEETQPLGTCAPTPGSYASEVTKSAPVLESAQ